MTMFERVSLHRDGSDGATVRQLTVFGIGLGILAVAINAIFLFVVIPELSDRLTPFYNQNRFIDGYDLLATNLVEGNGYRFYPETAETLMREPGYPLLLAGILLVFGKSFTAVRVVNFCLASATAWLMPMIVCRLSSNRLLISVPPLLFLFHPGTVVAESRGGVEILFAFLITLFLLSLLHARDCNHWWCFAVTGGVLGLTVLVRSTLLMFPLFLLGYLLVFEWRESSKLASFRNVAVIIGSMFVVLSPWIIRNYRLTGRFVPTASVLGVSAHTGQYICLHHADGKPWVDLDGDAARERATLAHQLGYRFKDGYYQLFCSSPDELRFSTYLAKRVMVEYGKTPLLCARCIADNLFNFWFAGKTWKSTIMTMFVQLPYLILGITGAVRSLRNGHAKVVGPLVLLILYVVAIHSPILAQARYSVPLLPFLSIFAAVTLVATLGKAGLGDAAFTTRTPVIKPQRTGTILHGVRPGSVLRNISTAE
jgi:Dolichyl-phosphate-mannose-protein mannosyltransferase